jgi:AcrR family transcriptional regulator
MRMVAREAGIAAPSVYSQYPDAHSMMADVVRECWHQLGATMGDAADLGATNAAAVRLQAQMSAYVRYAMERPSRYQLLFAPPIDTARFPDLPGLLQPPYRQVHDTIASLLAAGAKLPFSDPGQAAILIISIAHGRIAIAHLAPNRAGNTIEGVEAFVATALDGLLKA